MRHHEICFKQIVQTGILTLASLATLISPAKAQQSITPPNGWAPYGPAITMSTIQNGYSNNLTCGACVTTRDQVVSSNLNYRIYKNFVPTNDAYDYYLVTGNFGQAVQGSGDTSNVWSVGIFGTNMKLNVNGNGAHVMDYGPVSTSGSSTTGFSVGAGVGTGLNNTASFGFSSSYSTPDTAITSTADSNQMTIQTVLPGPGVGGDPNPKPNAYGMTYQGAIVYRVQQGADFKVSITDSVQWGYTFPRATQIESYTAWHSGVFQANFSNRELVQGTSGQCLSVQGKSLTAGQPVVLEPCTGDSSQRWSYTQYGQVQSAMSSAPKMLFCMDTVSGRVSSTSALVIETCTGPVVDATGTQTATVKPSQILQLGQVWDYDEAPTTPAVSNKGFWACGIYSNTSLNITQDLSCTGDPSQRPSNLVISSVSGAVPLGGAGDNLVITSGMSNAVGTPVYFHSVGAQEHILKNAIESQTPVSPSFTAVATPLYENSFFTLR